MKLNTLISSLLLAIGINAVAFADANWTGGDINDLWSNAANWDPGIPQSATTQGVDDSNVARNRLNGSSILIEAGINAVAFGVQIGYPITELSPSQASSNVLNMTGGSLTTQGNYLMNIGRGHNDDPNQLVQFNMSGGELNAAGITVPEGFSPSIPGFTSVGINAEMHVSGNSVVKTDLLRLGSADSKSTVTISDNAIISLTDENAGFAPGVLWIEAFENPIVGTSLLDIRDNGQLRIEGEWWTDENENGQRDQATVSEMHYFIDNYIGNGWIVANGGASQVISEFIDPDKDGNGTIVFSAEPFDDSTCYVVNSRNGNTINFCL